MEYMFLSFCVVIILLPRYVLYQFKTAIVTNPVAGSNKVTHRFHAFQPSLNLRPPKAHELSYNPAYE